MNDEEVALLTPIFGDELRDEDWRQRSYSFLEEFVTAATLPDGSVDTDAAVSRLDAALRSLSNPHFAFLLVHCGFIPDHYGADSSEETLHTKLTETVVCEWGRRLGMDSVLQKAKSSKEDVTFRMGGSVVVSDAKSFRLGRSQAAPNVKDAIKRGDYQKWLEGYPVESRLGGLITFPSKHDWKTGSDAYSYVSAPGDPILLIFYEHMAYMALHSADAIAHGGVFSVLSSYPAIFQGKGSKKRDKYWEAILPRLSRLTVADNLDSFIETVQPIIQDAVNWAASRIEDRVAAITDQAREHVASLDEDVLRDSLVQSISERGSADLVRYLKNINRFRR